jgi:hypothetical protein
MGELVSTAVIGRCKAKLEKLGTFSRSYGDEPNAQICGMRSSFPLPD